MANPRTAVAGTVLTLAACAVATARAQMPDSYRRVQLAMLETDRRKIAHAAGSVPEIASYILLGPRPALPDTATSYATRAGLRAYINAAYDYGANLLRTQPAADREASVRFFGPTIPKWQVWDEIHQHTIWTLGQVVANFRAHGNPPPEFLFF